MIGIDEVGRGCWAGPLLVVAARPRQKLPNSLADSKVLSKSRRLALFGRICASCQLAEGWVAPQEIDRLGLTAATRLAVRRALLQLAPSNDEPIVLDGNINYCPSRFSKVQVVIGADASVPLVSAASIYAKVRRDQYMTEAAKQFPNYAFERHVGYGTAQHRRALQTYGVSQIHRLSYRPVRACL